MKNTFWKDVKLSVLGKEIDVKPIDFTDNNKYDAPFEGYVGKITILRDEFEEFDKRIPRVRKLTNFQRKKAWKRFCKNFEINYDKIKNNI